MDISQLFYLKTLSCTIEIAHPPYPRTPAASPSAPPCDSTNRTHLSHAPRSRTRTPSPSLRSKRPLGLSPETTMNPPATITSLSISRTLSLRLPQCEDGTPSECQFARPYLQTRTRNAHK